MCRVKEHPIPVQKSSEKHAVSVLCSCVFRGDQVSGDRYLLACMGEEIGHAQGLLVLICEQTERGTQRVPENFDLVECIVEFIMGKGRGYNFWVKIIVAIISLMLLTAIIIELVSRGMLH